MQGCALLPGWAYSLLFATLLGAIAPAPAQAQSTNLLANPTFTGIDPVSQLPSGYWHQRSFDAQCAGSLPPFPVSYTYGVDGAPYMDIDVHNNSANCSANYVLIMPMTGSSATLVMGAEYRIAGSVAVMQHDGTSNGSLGYHLMDSNGDYRGEAPRVYLNGLTTDQALILDYSAGEPVPSGHVPRAVLPRVTAYSIQPGHHLRLRLKNPSVTMTSPATAVAVNGLINPVLMSGTGKQLKLSVPVKPIAYTGSGITSAISFVDVNGVTRGSWPARAVSFLNANSWAMAYDAWQAPLPALAPGRYTIRYSLSLPAVSTMAGPGATETILSGLKRYDVGTLIVTDKAGLYVGQHFHRYPGPNSGLPLPSGFAYKFARSHNHDGASNFADSMTSMAWWTGDGLYDWTLFDNWANFHAGQGETAKKKLLVTFMGSPPWLSSNNSFNTYYPAHGLLAAPSNLTTYTRMVTDTVTRYKDRIFAVECWNEPDAGFFGPNPSSTESAGTQLADICKAISKATKAVDPTIATICPQTSSPSYMKTWLSAKTSEQEPITDYCDLVGSHAYSKTGTSPTGQNYVVPAGGLMQTIKEMRATLQDMGVNKPIAITESGFFDHDSSYWTNGTVFSQMTPAARAEVSYQTLATARELGVVLYGLYSFDGGASDNAPLGLEGNGFGSNAAAENQIVNTRNAAATTDFGPSGLGLLPPSMDLFMVPTATTVSMAGSVALNFKLTVANTTLVAAKSLAVSIVPSASSYQSNGGSTGSAGSSVYTIDSLVGPAGSSCSQSLPTVNRQTVTQWNCQNMTVPAGGFVTLTANGRATPSSKQLNWLNNWNYTYNWTVSASASWAHRLPSVPVPTVTSAKIVVTK